MYTIAEIAFWVSILSVGQTYLFYPLWLRWVTFKKQNNNILYALIDDMPPVAVLIAACNEEKVIEQKIESVFATSYPVSKLHVFIGSDGSTDNTGPIVQALQKKYGQLHFSHFAGRNGKAATVNKLAAQAVDKLGSDSILIMTDANIYFNTETIEQLVIHFKNEKIGLVGANVINQVARGNAVGELESLYIGRENEVKYLEGLNHGSLMGAFGACFALRASLFVPIPVNLIVDDFYLCMKVHEMGKQCIYAIESLCYEDVPGNMWVEFRRKRRIAMGNFQNTILFAKHLLQPYKRIGFAFWSHKILRWFTPLFLIALLICSYLLTPHFLFYKAVFYTGLLTVAVMLVDLLLWVIGINIKWMRSFTYFYLMNIALLFGMLGWMIGIKTATWKPTERETGLQSPVDGTGK